MISETRASKKSGLKKFADKPTTSTQKSVDNHLPLSGLLNFLGSLVSTCIVLWTI